MARRPRPADDDISLFPFLSIIACVIGVLTTMIATLVLAQTDTPDIAMIEEYEQKDKALEKIASEVEELRREVSVSNSTALVLRDERRALQISFEDLQELLAEFERVEQELAQQKKVQVVIPPIDVKMRETATEMQTEYDSMKQQIAQLEKDLTDRKDRSEAKVTVLPQGSGLNFTPHFVECAETSIVMHNLNPAKRVRTGDAVKDKDFLQLLELVANGADDSIVFMVRSDGLSTYRTCKKLCTDRDIRNGKIPVVGQGRIDLTAFAK